MDTQEKNMKIEALEAELQAELRKVYAWHNKEIERIRTELKEKGLYQLGLDTNREYYAPITAEGKARMKALVEKYQAMADELEKE